MKTRLRTLVVPLIAAFAVAGCSDDNENNMGPGATAPDLSGNYVLVTITQAGITLGPPAATGSFTLVQTVNTGSEASGTVVLALVLPDGMGGVNNINDNGTYTVRSDGTWEQEFPSQQAVGTYAVVGSNLTVTVTDPPPAASVSVWQKQ